MTLLVDIGTNAEIILGNKNKIVAASSPTGPAFEGAEISCGQRAAPGARRAVATGAPSRGGPRRSGQSTRSEPKEIVVAAIDAARSDRGD